MRVLFVDDEPRILEAMQRKLFHRCDDWEIECAESGAEALDELAEEDYDVVVSDMRMPGMTAPSCSPGCRSCIRGSCASSYPATPSSRPPCARCP